MISNRDLILFLQRRHPDYGRMFARWKFFEDTYEGGPDWFVEHIHRYIKEGDKEFTDRLQRAFRFNHTHEVVDLVQKYIFKSPVDRNTGDASPAVQAFWKNTTLGGMSIDEHMRVCSTLSSIFGRIYGVVDSSKRVSGGSQADDKVSKARIYTYPLKPFDALDMGFGEDGDLNWMLICEHVRDDKDPLTATGAMQDRYRLWGRDQWRLYEIQDDDGNVYSVNDVAWGGSDSMTPVCGDKAVTVKLVDEGANELGFVPIIPLDNVLGDNRYSAPALIADVAYQDRAVANYLSNLDAIIQDQTFSQLVMPSQSVKPGDDSYNALLEMGTKRIFTYDGEGGTAPAYISPDVKQADLILAVINKIIGEIYHTLGMGGERTKQDNAVGIDNSSGVAKAYDFERLNSLLVTKSKALENFENRMAMMVDAYNGKKADAPDELVVYADTFDVRSLFDEFTVADRLMLIGAPDSLRQEQMKQVADKLFPALKKDLRAKIDADIASWKPTELAQAQIISTDTGSPGSNFPSKAITTAGGGKGTPAPKNPQQQNRQGQNNKDAKAA